MFVIPVFNDPYYEEIVTLEGVDYRFTFLWNKRASSWSMTIADQDGDIIAAGRKIVVFYSLLRKVTDARRPPGELYAVDTSSDGIDPSFDDFGTRVLLCYFPADEVAEVRALSSAPPEGT